MEIAPGANDLMRRASAGEAIPPVQWQTVGA